MITYHSTSAAGEHLYIIDEKQAALFNILKKLDLKSIPNFMVMSPTTSEPGWLTYNVVTTTTNFTLKS